jgi:hypothetical protein
MSVQPTMRILASYYKYRGKSASPCNAVYVVESRTHSGFTYRCFLLLLTLKFLLASEGRMRNLASPILIIHFEAVRRYFSYELVQLPASS